MTITQPIRITRSAPGARSREVIPEKAPPLNAGDRLGSAEFERRYEAHPEIKKAELVEGVVHVPSPTHFSHHSSPHAAIVGWLIGYCAGTPGTLVGDNATVRLDDANNLQPDAILRLEPVRGGTSRLSDDDYVEGPPDLVAEVAASSAAYDLHDKLRAYQRNGVREYLVLQVTERRVNWFVLRDGVYDRLQPDTAGVLRSELFPGLWLRAEMLWTGDLAGLLAVLQQGLASPEHADFMASILSA